MKNKQDIQKEISAIENLSSTDIEEMKPSAWKRLQKKLELLRLFVIYLETHPTEEFVRSEIARIEMIVSAKMLLFNPEAYEDLPKKEVSKLRLKHEAMYDIKKMRSQVRNMRMLLK